MKRLFLCLLLSLLAGAGHGQTALPVRFTATASPAAAHPGEAVAVTIRAQIDPGWHVYSVVPAATGPAATGDYRARGCGPARTDF